MFTLVKTLHVYFVCETKFTQEESIYQTRGVRNVAIM